MKPQEIFVLVVLGIGFLMTLAFRYTELGSHEFVGRNAVQSFQEIQPDNPIVESPEKIKLQTSSRDNGI